MGAKRQKSGSGAWGVGVLMAAECAQPLLTTRPQDYGQKRAVLFPAAERYQ